MPPRDPVRIDDGIALGGRSRPSMEREKGRHDQAPECGHMVPADRLAQVKDGKHGEHRDRDDLLDYLKLGAGIDRVADAVGGHRETVLERRDTQLTGITIHSATPGKRNWPYHANVMNTF